MLRTLPRMTTLPNRIVPSNIEAEQAVLGSVLLDAEFSFQNIKLEPIDFYLEKHGWIFEAMLTLKNRNESIDNITLADELDRKGLLNDVGGVAYITSLLNAVPSALNVKHYGEIVRDTSTRRKFISASGDIAGFAYDMELPIDQVKHHSMEALSRVNTNATESLVSAYEVGWQYGNKQEQILLNPGHTFGIPTGFRALDRVIGGLDNEYYIIAGRPAMGKSALVQGTVLNIARMWREQGVNKSVAIFTLEVSSESNFRRLLAIRYGYEIRELKTGLKARGDGVYSPFKEAEREELFLQIRDIGTLPIFFNDATGITTAEAMDAVIEKQNSEYPVGLVIFDYLGLAGDVPIGRGDGRTQQVGAISRGLKKISSSLKIPVLALAQLNRSVEGRADHRPTLSDLRDSGDVEQDAFAVMFVHREKYYYPTLELWQAAHKKNEQYPGDTASVIIAKNKDGATEDVPLFFDEKHVRFTDVESVYA